MTGQIPRCGRLDWVPVGDRRDLLAGPVAASMTDDPEAYVAPIDPDLADTAKFCEHYDVPLEISVNCVIVAARRAEVTLYAACMVAATHRVDVNGVVRRHLGARKASFAPMADATSMTGMASGGITPFGLPDGWPVLVDDAVTALPWAVVGSGVRGSKLLVPGALLAGLRDAEELSLASG